MTDSASLPSTGSAPPAPDLPPSPPQGALQRLLGVLMAPTQTFRGVAERPTWLVPMILLVVLGVGLTALIMPRVDWETGLRAQMETKGQEVPEEQMPMVVNVTKISIWVSSVVGPWIIYPLLGGLFFLIFKILGSEIRFKQSLSVVLHAYTPFWLVLPLLAIPVLLGRGELSFQELQGTTYLMSNLGMLATEDTGMPLRRLLESIDLFSIWTITLLTIGYKVVARVSTAKALTPILVMWSVFVALKVAVESLG